MQIFISILLLFFFSCATKSETKDNLPKEDRTAKLRILFENSQNNNTILRIYLCKELPESFIWIGSIVISIQVRFPIPLPLFMGSFAIKRDIKHNLK